jgi:hypothetical protein
MRKTSLLAAAGAAVGLVLSVGTAGAQSPATRTIQVPAGAVVLVLPGMAPDATRVLVPAQRLEAGMPMQPLTMTGFDDVFRQMDAQIDAQMHRMMAIAQHGFERGFAMPGPNGLVDAALGDAPRLGTGMVVTSFSDGRHSCTQRVTYTGNGAAPVIQTSGNGCTGVATGLPTPAAGHDTMMPREPAPGLVQASRQITTSPHNLELAALTR